MPPRHLLATVIAALVLALAGCGSGGDEDAGPPDPGGLRTLRTTSVTGAKPSAAVGDTAVILVDGAMPRPERISDPVLPDLITASMDASGTGTSAVHASDRIDLRIVDAATIAIDTTEPVYTSGSLTGTNVYGVTAVMGTPASAAASGLYETTISAVTVAGSLGLSVGDIGTMVVGPTHVAMSQLHRANDLVGLLADPGGWVAQASTWDEPGGVVVTDRLTLQTDLSAGTLRSTDSGGTTRGSVSFTAVEVAFPSPATAHVDTLFAGNVSGFTDTMYIGARYAQGAALTITVDGHLVTVSNGVSGEAFHISQWTRDPSGTSYTLSAIRGFLEPAVTATDRRVVAALQLTVTRPAAAWEVQSGQLDYALFADPDPATESTLSDRRLGSLSLEP